MPSSRIRFRRRQTCLQLNVRRRRKNKYIFDFVLLVLIKSRSRRDKKGKQRSTYNQPSVFNHLGFHSNTNTHQSLLAILCFLRVPDSMPGDTHSRYWYLGTIHPHKKTHGITMPWLPYTLLHVCLAHKITMTRSRQKTALFCRSILAGHNTHTHSVHPAQV